MLIINFKFKASLYMRIVVLKAKNIHTGIFWVMTPYISVGRYQLFEGKYFLHLQVISKPQTWRLFVSQKY
jgi:hypothetical protein